MVRLFAACLALMLAGTTTQSRADHTQRHTASTLQEARAVVVTGRNDLPYQDTLRGLRESVGSQLRLEQLPPGDTSNRAAEAAARSSLTIAIGAGAASAVQDSARTLVSCLVMNPGVHRPAQERYGVMLEHPLSAQFAWMRRMLPRARRIGVIYNPAENQARINAAAVAARAAGLELVTRPVESPQDIPDALARLGEKIDALWGIGDALTLNPETARRFLIFSYEERIPLIGPSDAWVAAGALYALGWDFEDIGRQCGEVALQVARGLRPTPAWVGPRKTAYSINLRAAERFRLTLPQDVIKGASRIHE